MLNEDHVLSCFINPSDLTAPAIPLRFLTTTELTKWLKDQPDRIKNWICAHNFNAKFKQLISIPNEQGDLEIVLVGMNEANSLDAVGWCVNQILPHIYQFEHEDQTWLQQACFEWGKLSYRYNKFKASDKKKAQLVWPTKVDQNRIITMLMAIYWVRDMVNEPTETFSVPELAEQIKQLGHKFQAKVTEVIGDQLLENNYPLVHAVGRAGPHEPRFLHLEWGNDEDPILCLVGKGVCYDTGGLSLKPTRGMLTMKKDMGGAANAIATAFLVMSFKLPVKCHLLIPAVENSVSDNSYRPGDVFIARNGLSVEITNTDAEGRLVLADALAQAAELKPNLIIDYATLTGAARVALGPDISAGMSQPAALAEELSTLTVKQDPVTALPLYKPYLQYLKSDIADCVNSSSSGFAGAITAGLFLQQFVKDFDWIHLDVHNWNEKAINHGPVGGEAMGLFNIWHYLLRRFKPGKKVAAHE